MPPSPDYITPALRETGRCLARTAWRLRAWRKERRLGRALTHLGLLGWEQAEYDAATQQLVDEIHHVEREQTRLYNEAADLALNLRQTREEAEQARQEYQEQRRKLGAEERRAREERVELERRLAEKRKAEPNFERRIPELDRELREVSKLLSELLQVEPQTNQLRQEILNLRERNVAIPNEKSDLRTLHLRVVSEIRQLETALAKQQQEAAEAHTRMTEHEMAWGAREAEEQARLRAAEREKARLEKHIGELEGAKANPYQAIGRVLAQANLAPMNQPQALEAVKGLEGHLDALRQAQAESRAASAGEDAQRLRLSLGLWGAILVALACLLAVVF